MQVPDSIVSCAINGVMRAQEGGKVAVHPSELGEARTGGIAGPVGMEQFSSVCVQGARSGARELSGMEVDHQYEETRNVGGDLGCILTESCLGHAALTRAARPESS